MGDKVEVDAGGAEEAVHPSDEFLHTALSIFADLVNVWCFWVALMPLSQRKNDYLLREGVSLVLVSLVHLPFALVAHVVCFFRVFYDQGARCYR